MIDRHGTLAARPVARVPARGGTNLGKRHAAERLVVGRLVAAPPAAYCLFPDVRWSARTSTRLGTGDGAGGLTLGHPERRCLALATFGEGPSPILFRATAWARFGACHVGRQARPGGRTWTI
jgi:hypothetical protein